MKKINVILFGFLVWLFTIHYPFFNCFGAEKLLSETKSRIESPRETASGGSEAKLVAYWSFDEGEGEIAKDDSGNGHDGEIQGAKYTQGKIGYCLQFDGEENVVIVPHEDDLNLIDACSIEMWVKISGSNGKWQNVLSKWGNTRNYGIYFDKVSGRFVFSASYENSPNPFTDLSSGFSIWDNQWHHLVAVFDGSNKILKMYADGKEVKTHNVGFSQIKTNEGSLKIGGSTPGLIDEVKIYSRALSKDEIEAHYRKISEEERKKKIEEEKKKISKENFIYLSDIEPASFKQSYGILARDCRIRGREGEGEKYLISLSGKEYKKGLGAHSNSEIIYKIDGKFEKFQSWIGLDYRVGEQGSIIFEIYGDGSKLFSSKTFTPESTAQFIDIPISGIKELKLVVLDAGDGIGYDHANWADAILLKKGITTPPSTSYSIPKPVERMTLLELQELAINPDISKDPNPPENLVRPILFSNKNLLVWFENPCQKVFPQDKVNIAGSPSISSVQISSAKNEYEPFQLVFSPNKEIKKIKLEFSGLKNKTTGEIASNADFEYNVVGYVFIETPSFAKWMQHMITETRRKGYVPDPLLKAREIDLKPGKNQPFWCTIYIPENFKAGNYAGKIKVLADGSVLTEIDLELKVYDFVLPDTKGLDAYVGIGPVAFARYDKRDLYKVIFPEVLKNMRKHRLCMSHGEFHLVKTSLDEKTGKLIVDTSNYETYLNLCVNELKYKRFFVPWRPVFQGDPLPFLEKSMFSDEYNKLVEEYFQIISNFLRKKGLIDRAILFLWDEPHASPKVYPDVMRLIKLIKEVAPEIKIYTSTWWTQELSDVQDIFAEYDRLIDRERLRTALDKGKEIWSTDGTPLLYTDHLGIEARLLAWINWKHNITGIDYWSIHAWPKNPWTTTITWEGGGGALTNGNGCLVYPDETGVLPSIRLELLREGLEDYVYLELLKEKIEECKKKGGSEKILNEAKNILDQATNFIQDPVLDKEKLAKTTNTDILVFTSTFVFDRNPESLYKTRKGIAEMIMKLK